MYTGLTAPSATGMFLPLISTRRRELSVASAVSTLPKIVVRPRTSSSVE